MSSNLTPSASPIWTGGKTSICVQGRVTETWLWMESSALPLSAYAVLPLNETPPVVLDGLNPTSHTPHTTCGIFRSFAVIVLANAKVLAGIFSEYLRKAVL